MILVIILALVILLLVVRRRKALPARTDIQKQDNELITVILPTIGKDQ